MEYRAIRTCFPGTVNCLHHAAVTASHAAGHTRFQANPGGDLSFAAFGTDRLQHARWPAGPYDITPGVQSIKVKKRVAPISQFSVFRINVQSVDPFRYPIYKGSPILARYAEMDFGRSILLAGEEKRRDSYCSGKAMGTTPGRFGETVSEGAS
jgi:hypothetical protein